MKAHKETEVSENDILVKCVQHRPSRIADLIEQEKPDSLYLPWSSVPFLSRLKRKMPTLIDYVGAGLLEEYATRGQIPIALLQMKLNSFWSGDFFMTAGLRERYYLMGLLAASKRLSYGKRRQTGSLIHVIPMTPPPESPKLEEKVIKKKPADFVVLVAGAFLPWYDYRTFFQALEILNKKGKSNLKVVFMGGNPRDPNFEHFIQEMGNLPALQKNIIYTGIVPFKKRANYYLLADVAVNIPCVTIEDELAVRTRVVDYVWAGLPIITPANDEYSEVVVNGGAGFAYNAGDPHSLAQKMGLVEENRKELEKAKSKMQSILRKKFNLQSYISPLESFIEHPYVDPARTSPRGVGSDLFLWARDILNLMKR